MNKYTLEEKTKKSMEKRSCSTRKGEGGGHRKLYHIG
jgi:hypothetical protein